MPKQKSRARYWQAFPERVYISHAYNNAAAVEKLVRKLTEHIEPVIFPRRDPDPSEAISDGIVVAIR